MESFKSTLDEVREADILLHVVDISHHRFEDQIKIVNDTLKEIDSLDKPTILAFNKMDLLLKNNNLDEDNPEFESTDKLVENLQRRYLEMNGSETVFMSAATRDKLNHKFELGNGSFSTEDKFVQTLEK